MKSMLGKKIIFLVFSGLLAAFALTVIEELIQERLHYQDQAKRSVAHAWSGEQQVFGPMLVVPHHYREVKSVWDGKLEKYINRTVEHRSVLYIIPEHLKLDSQMTTQQRARGIFSFPVFTSQMTLAGEFDLTEYNRLKNMPNVFNIETPYLAVTLSDMRGINNKPILNWQSSQRNFAAGSNLSFSPQGVHAPLENLTGTRAKFDFELNLRGMDTLWFTPIAKDTKVDLAASWPHPNFVGQFLPTEREISQQQFQAKWQVSEFSSNITQDVTRCQTGDCSGLMSNRFGVSLNTPVDIYRQSIRSAKYGLLFVGLTFISFFVFEVLKRLQIHPVQYTLVALALSVFYLLLIALSEHLGFLMAYALATSACVLLLTFYVASILRNVKWGLGFGGFIALLYVLLYVILSSEDHALLLGAGLVFAALVLVMAATRHLDWYQVSNWASEKAKAQLYRAKQEEQWADDLLDEPEAPISQSKD
ncbi:cell envelope integrity protein CreD [Motilimonas sp. 1_MG-2023]|uniref:cell envelope integrity protein CreD n=1 Tax=Motilimonas sp. 1_MG-2023 TaxID=3062672 RepID=UPI0026E1F5B7|nr:cell envelope integrity protein CreD [Motilimonas sp. 1_MG-2023]MDO6527951.1 cell envelope integrity protein CreD [Motilimonas sp. 1_MG-2023]